jgi:hypothetical protein
MMPRLQVALQQTLRGLSNHRKRLFAARLASHPRAWTKPLGSLAEQRIVIRPWALSRAVHAG